MPEVLNRDGSQSHPFLGRGSAATMPNLVMYPLTSAVTNLSPLRWKRVGVLGETSRFIDRLLWRQGCSQEKMGGPWPRKGSARNVFYIISSDLSGRHLTSSTPPKRVCETVKCLKGGGKRKEMCCSWRGISTQTLRRELYELDGRRVLKEWRDTTAVDHSR